MAKVTTYKNSKLATVVSVIGYLCIVGGVYALFNDEPVAGIIVVVLGIGFKVLAAYISQKKKERDAKKGINF